MMGKMLENFGGKKAVAFSLTHRLRNSLGCFSRQKDIDFGRVDRLIFICMGNINRSAYADAVARNSGINSSSYGLIADESKGASSTAIRIAKMRGIALESHQCRHIGNITLTANDLVLGVEPAHLSSIQAAMGDNGAQLSLLGLWAVAQRPFIQDPICRNDAYFHRCFDTIEQAIKRLDQELKRGQG